MSGGSLRLVGNMVRLVRRVLVYRLMCGIVTVERCGVDGCWYMLFGLRFCLSMVCVVDAVG